ncbi:MAG: hypothetical protein ACRC0V_07205 [Fusobacteriaceae bacterium]|uniref:hypothetical protein n=1 Tax=Romboutsia sp. TaxID=1965302 RepID=UPI003F417630
MATLGRMAIQKIEYNGQNMTDSNHLGTMLKTAPHKMMGKIDQIFASKNYYSNNPLAHILGPEVGSTITIGGVEYEWELRGATTRPLITLENVNAPSVTAPGKYKSKFKIKLDENWFMETDVLSPGTSSNKYNCIVVEAPRRDGNGYVYTVQLLTQNDSDFLPLNLLKPGQQWSKLYSASGEAATKGGSTQLGREMKFRNKIAKSRKQYRVTDYASTAVLAVPLTDRDGNQHPTWMNYAEVEFHKQWQEEREVMRWYGRQGDVYQDENGYRYETGPGLHEQLEDSHIEYYTNLTTDLIDQYLMDIFYGRVGPGNTHRNLKAFTGEWGMINFHKAISSAITKKGLIQNIEVFTNKTNSDLANKTYEYGIQYTRYNLTNGGSLELIHNPLYDNKIYNNEIDPFSGKPVESMRLTILDFSDTDGEKNVKLVKKKGGDFFNYICGNYGPMGPNDRSGKFGSAHAGDYYSMHIGGHEGVYVKDITKCGELKFALN